MKAIYIPSGAKNLVPLFPGVNFSNVAEYFVQLKNSDDEIICTSNLYRLKIGCDDTIRIHFLNSLGAIDAANFDEVIIQQETDSDARRIAPTVPLQKPVHATNRFNIRANDKYIVKTTDYGEDDMPWIEELFNSPIAWIEWKGIQSQADSYLPIVIADSKFEKLKSDGRYIYEVEVQFILSHPKFIIR
jgi:uncharacterized protein YegP (UPF0339 family)